MRKRGYSKGHHCKVCDKEVTNNYFRCWEHRKIEKGKNSRPYRKTGKTILCQNCKAPFYVKRYRIKSRKFCSKKCFFNFRRGDKHWNWQNGKSFEPYAIDWTETLRRAIRERDKYICKVCGLYGLDVHHIDYNKKNCELSNLITLCRSCHIKTNNNRGYWINFFANKV